ncbi:T-lymphocyte activation antigen CD86-like isoform X2 [Syngnathoides biaculeatus]|uniref:T-lymphocyte activation antigen CD86-like isoform X2 n=1 Tax=Syngnathoides biaculeatus TaxID=300417 RepID=UPI002ADD3C80|nr:T-lymphocyte activation antigen CD86-like isoform X2 [Syngnathoides biaculeatus]
MVSSWVAPQFIKTTIARQLLTVIFAVSLSLAPRESFAEIHLRGEVGENVTVRCPVDRHKTLTFLYFQKGKEFVNGFHRLKNIQRKRWENTSVEEDDAAVQMCNLKASQSGEYQCYIQYKDETNVSDSVIHLSVTAKYSKPTVITLCHAKRCLLTCTSHGGYPRTKLTWNVIGNSSGLIWTDRKESEDSDPNTMLYNISSTVSFNCSYGEQMFIGCSVGDVTSEFLAVCVPKDRPHIRKLTICSIVLFIAIIVLFPVWKCVKNVLQ